MKKLVILSGAGMSQESGIATFRDGNGLWENHDVNDVATPEAWERNKELVLKFYNARRKDVLNAKPNRGHLLIADLEKYFEVDVITQNVDDLHERAGSSKVLHLHGEIRKSRSTKNPNLIYDIKGADLNLSDKCELGSQLRPHIVWFGEAVPAMEKAVEIVDKADILLIIGTSLNVYPAAGLMNYAHRDCQKYLIDPGEVAGRYFSDVEVIREKASKGMEIFMQKVLEV